VPASLVPSVDEIVADPDLHMGVISENEHPVIGPYRQIEPAARFSKSPQSVRRTAPMLAEHTREILGELGYDDGDIDGLIEQGAASVGRPRAHADIAAPEEA
jgi:crotonobetainyl-CoA:carnitine CoA-transferase CaiB-like acyl-CoA transferase